MMILYEAGVDQGGFGAAEGASQQLTVLREPAGFVSRWQGFVEGGSLATLSLACGGEV